MAGLLTIYVNHWLDLLKCFVCCSIEALIEAFERSYLAGDSLLVKAPTAMAQCPEIVSWTSALPPEHVADPLQRASLGDAVELPKSHGNSAIARHI
jgi:hypothetical protein